MESKKFFFSPKKFILLKKVFWKKLG